MSHKKDGKNFTFDTFCELLIKDRQKLLEEGKLGGKNQNHFMLFTYQDLMIIGPRERKEEFT